LGRVQPYDRSMTFVEMFNEGTILLCMYCFMCFTPFVPDLLVRHYLGYFVCAIVSVNLLFNYYLLGLNLLHRLRYEYFVYYARKDL